MAAYRTLLAARAGAGPAGRAARRRCSACAAAARLALKLGAGPDSWAAMALDYTASHLDWLAADEVRARVGAQLRGVFNRFDVILAPIDPVAGLPARPPPVPAPHPDALRREQDPLPGRCCAGSRWPPPAACRPPRSRPARRPAGLPVGAQLIGPRGADARTLAVAEAIEERLGGFVAPPPLEASPAS